MRRLMILLVAGFFLGSGAGFAGEKRALTFDDLIACKRLKDPQISPDGKQIAFTVQTMNEAENSSRTDIYLIS
ncbi:MAG TPA: S9 family peptidase, partial [Candidatus Marinimicrobia bacterium]|nr:S9 family peptidase [Candidatus Neomarinimicrobiota bacterium]